jgi:predicted TIM-barrel fold metal-dependent hydrolase
MKGLYRACGRLGLPLIIDFRLGTNGVIDPVGMTYLDECLREFPETVFVAHGPGWWAEMSADVIPAEKNSNQYPDRPVASPGRVAEFLGVYPNRYADLSARSCHRALTRDPGSARSFLITHSRKLMFGTDRFVDGYREEPVTLELTRKMDLPADTKHALFRGTAERLLGLREDSAG